MTLIERINSIFDDYSSVVGESALAPTGEPYITYSIGILIEDGITIEKTKEWAEQALLHTFLILRMPPAFTKVEGTPIVKVRLETGKQTIYWRRFPELEEYIDEDLHHIIKITCRALVSRKP